MELLPTLKRQSTTFTPPDFTNPPTKSSPPVTEETDPTLSVSSLKNECCLEYKLWLWNAHIRAVSEPEYSPDPSGNPPSPLTPTVLPLIFTQSWTPPKPTCDPSDELHPSAHICGCESCACLILHPAKHSGSPDSFDKWRLKAQMRSLLRLDAATGR
jgi:hypothetical protein